LNIVRLFSKSINDACLAKINIMGSSNMDIFYLVLRIFFI
jgi:hypothetical protein